MKTKNSKKNWGWVIQNKSKGTFVNRDTRYETAKSLKNALVYPSRNMARSDYYIYQENVLKVEVKGSTPIRVIGGNGTGCRF